MADKAPSDYYEDRPRGPFPEDRRGPAVPAPLSDEDLAILRGRLADCRHTLRFEVTRPDLESLLARLDAAEQTQRVPLRPLLEQCVRALRAYTGAVDGGDLAHADRLAQAALAAAEEVVGPPGG